MQILEEGRLTDSQGRVVDFKNTVIIMTTNLGTRDISRGVQTGFQSISDTQTGYERMKATVQEELRQHFRPEFLNRVDDVIVFPQLSREEIVEIVDLFVKSLQERLTEQILSIELNQEAKNLLANRGYDPSMGARPLRRTVQDLLEDKLSEKLLYGEIPAHSHIKVTATGEGKNDELEFEIIEQTDSIEAAPEREAIEAGSDS